jgi:hypothetical protein
MSETSSVQDRIIEKLRGYQLVVEKEWRITKNATDSFSPNVYTYAPRLDIAVGPFNVEESNKVEKADAIKSAFSKNAPQQLRDFIKYQNLKQNKNPRCMLAIEVAFSGSEKHFLGDITNASMMGLYGFVVANNSTLDNLKRIYQYAKIAKNIGKAPVDLFSNVCVILDEKFLCLLESQS